MRTLEWLTNPDLRPLLLTALASAMIIALLAAALAPLVVLKRLSFIGQGVAHAAFGGVALALALGLSSTATTHRLALLGVVVLFCVGAALLIGRMSGRADTGPRSAVGPDASIGVVLAGSMAAGLLLYRAAAARAQAAGDPAPPGLESVLFGDLLTIDAADLTATSLLALACLAALWWSRRDVLFWAFDEPACAAFGVPASRARALVLIVLAVAVVAAVKAAGIVLATALFVIPGAIGLRLASTLGSVVLCSLGAAALGVAVGTVLSLELAWPLGTSIVLTLCALLSLVWALIRPA
jgi:ABC-type Mn2+/Zn2+ transport system permease subunit